MKPRAKILDLVMTGLILSAGVIAAGACAAYEKPETAPPVFDRDLSLLAPEDFAGKIEELEEIAENHEDPGVRAEAYYFAALAHVHYGNPQPDYSRALASLDAYMAIDAEHPRENRNEVAVWQFVLSQMVTTLKDYEKLQKSYEDLRRRYRSVEDNRKFLGQQVEELAKTIERHRKEIAALEDKIKKLDALHAEIEKKKKKK
jgi:DNA repair exonuclease SbcCD ATPase subunit